MPYARSTSVLLAMVALFHAAEVRAEAAAPPAPPSKECSLTYAPLGTEGPYAVPAPANLPAFPLLPITYEATLTLANVRLVGPDAPTLRVIDDPRARGWKLAVLEGPLRANEKYELAFDPTCTTDQGQTIPLMDHSVEWTVRGGAAVPLPTTLGTASVGAPFETYPGMTPERATPLLVAPSPELRAYLSVMSFEILADGAPWLTYGYGQLRSYRMNANWSYDALEIPFVAAGVFRGQLSNDRSVCGVDRSPAHDVRIELRGHVAGAESDPEPLVVTVPIDCSTERATTVPVAPAAAPTSTPEGGGAESGCSQAPASRGTPVSMVIVGLALAAAAARRRSRSGA